jgi:hypothetical protein
MFSKFIFALLIVAPLTAFAGSATLDCQSKTGDVKFSAGNGSNKVTIKYVDSQTQQVGEYVAPVSAEPQYTYNTQESDSVITAIPVSAREVLSENYFQMHVVHKDGTECYGREKWDVQYVQTYVLTAKNGENLYTYNALSYKKVVDMTEDGYIVSSLSCHDYGITSAGGCFPQDGDTVTWERIPKP